jgi:hypothetical protein
MADLVILQENLRDTEAWKDKPWKQFQKVFFRLQKRIYRAYYRVPMTKAARVKSRMMGKLSRPVWERQ